MKTFKIQITETLEEILDIEADSVEQAIDIVNEMYRNCDIVLPTDHTYYSHTIEEYKE